MDPGQEKDQQDDQLEAHSVAPPADGSPTLEEHPDDGKDFGKVWSDVFPQMSDTMVSGGHGKESRCSSSSSGSSSQNEVGNKCTSSSSENEIGNDSTTSSRPTVDHTYAASQLLEVLPPNFKNLWDIEMAQKRQEGISQLASLEPTHGLDKQEEPISSPDDTRPIGISQRHQVGLVGDVAHVTSVTSLNQKRSKDSDSEEEPPVKKTRDTVAEEELSSKRTSESDGAEEESPSKRTRTCDDEEEPVLCPSQGTVHEDSFQSSPVSNPSPMTFWLDHFYSPFSISPESTSEDPILSSPVFSPLPRLTREGPIVSVHAISPPVSEDSVFSRPPSTEYEDPIVSSPVVSPSLSTYCKIPSMSFPCICVWMKSQMDKEEEPRPSTSGIGSDRIRERVTSRQVWFRPHYDLSSDSD
ncbi:uncharacterized protein LOC122819300 [Gambusia affinis]|uniref:uncharacterized protein LOC122819300 n=1 Tax=Gambusia affinis TaxID=33528 RepID=UPI001CDC32CD|nr:uncharacterized protein LOC122819300 [Gambusia affinis]XP_043951859.1 uncharacterized protein LOC122819300 [Gambusia affinis]XP_043951860.1 uncharacterized protein LOC122819300 [Gambusia affinis]